MNKYIVDLHLDQPLNIIELDITDTIEVCSLVIEELIKNNIEWDVIEYMTVTLEDKTQIKVRSDIVLANIGLHNEATELNKIINGEYDNGKI